MTTMTDQAKVEYVNSRARVHAIKARLSAIRKATKPYRVELNGLNKELKALKTTVKSMHAEFIASLSE